MNEKIEKAKKAGTNSRKGTIHVTLDAETQKAITGLAAKLKPLGVREATVRRLVAEEVASRSKGIDVAELVRQFVMSN